MWLCTAKAEEKKTQLKVNQNGADLLVSKHQWFLEHWLMMSECLGLPEACTEMWPCWLGPYMGNFPSVTKVENAEDAGPWLKLSLPPVLSAFCKNPFSGLDPTGIPRSALSVWSHGFRWALPSKDAPPASIGAAHRWLEGLTKKCSAITDV